MSMKSNTTRDGALDFNIFLALLAAAITFAIYIPALFNGFVNYDDPVYVYENAYIRSLDLNFLKWAFTIVFSNWHPLTLLSYGLDYSVWGLNPFGYHLTNVFFHSLNVFLVYVLAERLIRIFKTERLNIPAAAFVTAMLFGIHPLHVESVAWVSERKDMLSAFFFVLSILAYLKYVKAPAPMGYMLTFFFFILAIMSKSMAITLPVVLLILDYFPLGRLKDLRGAIKVGIEKAPFFAVSAITAIVTILAQKQVLASEEVITPTVRVFTAGHAYIFYIYKMLLPIELAPFYPHPVQIEVLSFPYAGSLALFIVFCALAVFAFKRRPLFIAVWFYFAITLLPVIGLIQVGGQAAADRYTYIPSMGPFMLAGLAAGYLAGRSKGALGYPLYASGLIIFALLSFLTVRQTAIWNSAVDFWSYEMKYMEQRPEFTEVKTIYINGEQYQYGPRIILAYLNRGDAYVMTGDYSNAVKDFSKFIELNPAYPSAFVKRALAYQKLGDHAKAIEDLDSAIKLDPYYRDAYYYRSNSYRSVGRDEDAEKDFRTEISLKRP